MPVEHTTTDSTGIQISVVDWADPEAVTPMPPDTVQVVPDSWAVGEPEEDPTKPILIGRSQEPVEVIIIDPGGA